MANLTRTEPTVQAVNLILAVIDADDLLDGLDEYRWTGRKGYSPTPCGTPTLPSICSRSPTRGTLLHDSKHPAFCAGCAASEIPSHPKAPSPDSSPDSPCIQDLVDQAFVNVTHCNNVVLAELQVEGKLPATNPSPGRAVVVDSSDIPTYANSRRHQSVDPLAAWG